MQVKEAVKAELSAELTQVWGRKAKATWYTAGGSLFLTLGCPAWLFINWVTLEYFDGALSSTLQTLRNSRGGPVAFFLHYAPRPSLEATLGYAAWLIFQAILFIWLPGPVSTGQRTPAGNLLKYKTNGLLAWAVTVTLALTAALFGFLDLTLPARHWEGLLVATNIYGILLAGFCLLKAHIAPSHPDDCKFSGSLIFDYFAGIELNPRFGELWDFKLFHNGRPGIIAWTLIDISYTASQYQKFGHVTNSMWMVDLFHLIYVVDFFVNEDWYLRTIDMTHDHYGFYLGWGSVALLPSVYTLQVQYLARYPVELSAMQATIILAIGLGGYALFRSANHQKDIIRSSNGRCDIWGQKADYIRCNYKTEDGQRHESLLLCSGWWGFSRHANYLGDIMQAFAMGAACGVTHFLPWSYTFFLAAILMNRIPRDEARCSGKYGKYWEEYCRKVPWRLIPGFI